MFGKKVELVAWLQNPEKNWGAEDSASCGARVCREKLSSDRIHDAKIKRTDYENRKENIFKETSGRGHGAVLDQSAFLFSIDNLTRASTLFLCEPEYASHLQQSLRVATAERGFYLPPNLDSEAERLMKKQFRLYETMQNNEIPPEDARFILPLYTKTTIQSLWDSRELMHLDSMSQRAGVPSEVRETVQQMMNLTREIAPHLMKNRETNYEILSWFPSSQLFAKENKTIENLISTHSDFAFLCYSGIDMSEESIKKAVEKRNEAELANLKHFHFTFIAPMSLACFHQATRQRTWNQSVQSLESAVRKGGYIIPPKISKSKFRGEYKDLNEESFSFVRNYLNDPEFLGVLPHSLVVHDLIHINGWNAIHSIGKRTCTEAQWEIRKIATKISIKIKEIVPGLGKYSVPQGILYGKCPEKNSCGKCNEK